MEFITVERKSFDLEDFLRESMFSQKFADLALCCSGGHKFLAHRLVLSAASPYLQEVLLAHNSSRNYCCEPITVILAEVEGPELAALLGFVYTGSAKLPRIRLEGFLRAADALKIRLPSFPTSLPALLPSLLSIPASLSMKDDFPSRTKLNMIACKEACCQRLLITKRQVANRVTASPWSQTARPHHSPRPKLLAPPRNHSQLPERLGYSAGYGGSTKEQAANLSENEASLTVNDPIHSVQVLQESSAMQESRSADDLMNKMEAHVHTCVQCNKSFASTASLKVHLRTHSGVKPYQCADCGKQFSQLRNYKYHRSVHEGTSEFAASCTVCGKYFNDRGYLSSHMKIHRNRKEYGCSQCGKSFNQRVAYNMHLRIHTGLKPHQCDQCGKAFSRKMLLKQHLRTHSGERPYQCQLCDKAFADRSNMMLHTRLHSGLKPYKCNLCSKAFTKKHHLKTHLNYHTGTKPYACPNCQITFSQSSNMRTHYKKCTTCKPFSLFTSSNAVVQKDQISPTTTL